MKKILGIFVSIVLLVSLGVGGKTPGAFAAETRSIFFPTDPSVTFSDDFLDPRWGHLHEGTGPHGPRKLTMFPKLSL